MQAEGNKCGRPILIGCAVPGAVAAVAPLQAVSAQFKIALAFPVAHLGLGDIHQILGQLSRIGIVPEHILPVQQGLHIRIGIAVAANAVDMLLLLADQHILLHTRGRMLMLRDAAAGVVGNGNAGHAQIPDGSNRNDQ